MHIESLASGDARSGRAFRVADAGGRGYKLRVCRRVGQARSIEAHVARMPALFPALLARDGRLLLFELLDGYRPLTRQQLLDAVGPVGERVAQLHAAGQGGGGRLSAALLLRARLRRDLWGLRAARVLEPPVMQRIEDKIRRHRVRFGLPLALELDDVHKGNLMWHAERDDLRYVDEEGVGYRLRGVSLATLLKTATSSEALEGFRAGYARVGDARWIVRPYMELVLLLDALRRAALRLRTATRMEKLPEELDELRAIAADGEGGLAWRFPRDAIRLRRRAARRAAGAAAAAGFPARIPDRDRPTPPVRRLPGPGSPAPRTRR